MSNITTDRARINYIDYLNRLKLNYELKSSIVQLIDRQGAHKLYKFCLKRLKLNYELRSSKVFLIDRQGAHKLYKFCLKWLKLNYELRSSKVFLTIDKARINYISRGRDDY